MVRVWLMTIAALLCALPAAAQLPARAQNIATTLEPETREVAPGDTVMLALRMRPKPGWHGYWKNPGDAGLGMRIAWQLPAGVSAGEPLYPVPQRLVISGIMNYVYEGDYTKLIPLRLAPGLAPGTRLPIRARLDYLACTDQICVPEQAEVAAEVVAAKATGPRGAFDEVRAKLPRPLGGEGSFALAGERIRIAIPLPQDFPLDDPYFFPNSAETLDHSAPQSFSRNGDFLILETRAGRGAAGMRELGGLLKVGEDRGFTLRAVPGAVPAAGEPLVRENWLPGFAAAFAGALLGGLLLNILPCVFPILSLKALSLARSGGSEKAAQREALAYAAGVILVCLALGGLLLVLRAGGELVGWAFQLQDPRVMLLLLLLVTAITLNLAGLFQLPGWGGGSRLVGQGGTSGAFWTGALAAFVATPCTGPFMGAALGAALLLPSAAALAVFGGLGLGLALPFLLIGFVPALRRRLPRPGPWMERFRRLLAWPMALTGLGLLWVLWRQAGGDGLLLGIAAALVLGAALAWRRSAGLGIAAAAGIAAILFVPQTIDPARAAASPLPSEPFSEARLAALRAEGRPVFVYFTADWCLTCKVNEAGVLGQEEVARAFADKGVAVLAGDWTRGDPAIGRFLERHGRSGVPLYLWYPPGGGAETLPQILTVGRLTELS